MLEIVMPIYWQQTKKKLVLVSLNAYRNWHYHTQNKYKQYFHDLVTEQLKGSEAIPEKYSLSCRFFFKRANCDASNVVPMMEKAALDAIVKAGLAVNDSVNYHVGTSWVVAGKDKENPRCEITIKKEE